MYFIDMLVYICVYVSMYIYKLTTVTLMYVYVVGLCGELHHLDCQNFTAVGPSSNKAVHYSLFVYMIIMYAW